jgi:acyl-CoA synthetase (AMP-forming)/AMP-acid ligase II/acyl carrier protein
MAVAQSPTGPVVADQVLDIVAGLVSELAGGTARRPTLDDSLDRDLGISSLERVELLLRVERTFGVRLPDSVMAEAATPRGLATAILHAAPASPEATPPVRQATAATLLPTTARSLVEALRAHADHTPDRIYIHLRNDDGSETPVTYGELATAAAAVAGGLRALGVAKGDRVALMPRTERAFFEAFFGAHAIGGVPVPLYPPVRAEDLLMYTHRQQAILRNADARMLVTFAETGRLGGVMRGALPSLDVITTPQRLSHNAPPVATWERPASDDPALIQYTSGSTGAPKGVPLSHANILANVRGIGEALEIRADDIGVSWLPLYHDMGLIGMWLAALYFGVPVAIMSPLAFLARPSRWLWAIHAHRGTISAAPNFAFDLCAGKVADEDIRGLDLSSWRVAVSGSEAVSPDTIDRFTRRFARYGFRAGAICPAYGLAESSVALSIDAIHHLSTASHESRSNGAGKSGRPRQTMRGRCGSSRVVDRCAIMTCESSAPLESCWAIASRAGFSFGVLR